MNVEADAPVNYGPAGRNFELPDFTPARRAADHEVSDGVCYWLSDSQADLTGAQAIWLYRSVCEVISSDGLQAAAQIDLDFDPEFEALIFHHVRVIRDGVTREVDPRDGMEVFRRERDLERAKYDGRLTAHFVIPDVRVGDIIDVARSVAGERPMFAGRFAAEWRFAWSCWVGETRVRVLAHVARQFAFKSWGSVPAMEERTQDGIVERTWRALATPGVVVEQDTASWERPFPAVRMSDVVTWAEVADSFRRFYDDEALPQDLEDQVALIAAEDGEPARRAVRALRLVQGGLRYQSVAIGDGGFVPRPLARIWASRSGDCKDASRLLTAIMRRLGLEADPALVNTVRGWALDQEPPSLNAFDHCIVRLKGEGRSYWLDPTRFPQGGTLDVLHQSRFGWALPLTEQAGLEAMGEDELVTIAEMKETFVIGPLPGGAGTLEVETIHRSWRADETRRRAENGAAALARDCLNYYARIHGEVTEAAPMELVDDLEANELRTRESYRLERTCVTAADKSHDRFETFDDLFASHLQPARAGPRRLAADLGPPRRLVTETMIHMPEAVNIDTWDQVFETPGVEATSRLTKLDAKGQAVRLTKSIAIDRRWLAPAQAEGFFDLRERAIPWSAVGVNFMAGGGKRRDWTRWIWVAAIIVWGLIAFARAFQG